MAFPIMLLGFRNPHVTQNSASRAGAAFISAAVRASAEQAAMASKKRAQPGLSRKTPACATDLRDPFLNLTL